MARPLRIEFPGATYHVTARGDRREPIFADDNDRAAMLDVLAQGLERFDAAALAYCLMGNHYHFVLQTRQPNLSRLMRHVNGVYTQRFNRRHQKVGHLFQGRFKAILVDSDTYLLAVCRYVELNPVRAALVATPVAWSWSSCRTHVGLAPAPAWLDTQGMHAQLLGRACKDPSDTARAAQRYAALLGSEPVLQLWPQALRQQIYLGDDAFVSRMQALASPQAAADAEVPRTQRRPPRGAGGAVDDNQMLKASWSARGADRSVALWRAYTEEGVTMTALAARCGLSVSRVSRLIAAVQAEAGAKGKT